MKTWLESALALVHDYTIHQGAYNVLKTEDSRIEAQLRYLALQAFLEAAAPKQATQESKQ